MELIEYISSIFLCYVKFCTVILWYNNVCILFDGYFASGKTTLCFKEMKNNVEVVSAD